MNKINANEMRNLIKSIFEFSQKLSGNINIKTIDNAAEFAVNIFGYKNWKEFKQNLKKENQKIILEQEESEIIKELLIFKKDKLIDNTSPIVFKKRENKQIFKKASEKYNNEWLVGSHLSKGMKTKQPRGLLSKDCIITGNYSNNSMITINNQINWLLEKNEDFIIFSKKEIENIKFPSNVEKVGINFKRLNPIKHLLNSESFDDFFKIENSNKSFSYIWSLIVKKLYTENKELTVTMLVDLTKLDKLLDLIKNFESDFVLNKMLSKYLFKYIDIIDDKFLIKKENEEKHYKENIYLINKLHKINELYENGFFSEKDEFSMKEAIFQKNSCVILDNENYLYRELIINEYTDAVKEFNKDKNINLNQHSIWVLFIEAESWLRNYQINNLINNEGFHHYFYVYQNYQKIDFIFKEITQILFLRQSVDYSNSIWKERMLNLTESYEINFWYNNNLILKTLSDGEAILWTINDDPFSKDGLESYKIEKIDLY